MNNRNMNNKKNIYRCLNDLNLRIILGLALILFLLMIIATFSILTYTKITNNVVVNKEGYAEEDIKAINKVRELFLAYLSSAKYDMFGKPELDLTDQLNNQSSYIIETAQWLLAKYGKIQVDADTFLSFDDNSRYITIVKGICTFETDVSVDIPVERNYYLFRESFVPTRSGTWCVYPSSLDDTFVYFEFGSEIHSSTIKSDYALEMIDKRFVNSSYLNHNEEDPYETNSSYYLFKNISDKIYIYNVDQKTWMSTEEIADVKLTDEFISLLTTNNILYMYCIKDCLLFKVGKIEKSLHLDSEDVAYLPDEYNVTYIRKLHKCTEE